MKAHITPFKINYRYTAGITTRAVTILVLLLSFTGVGQAQNLEVVERTEEYTEYVFDNPELKAYPPLEMLIKRSGQFPGYRILEHSVRRRELNTDQLNKYPRIPRQPASLTTTEGTHTYRKQPVTTLILRVARKAEEAPQDSAYIVTRRLRFRAYHPEGYPGQQISSTQGRIPQTDFETVQSNGSPFSSGQWYKIRFRRTGLYQLSAEYLEELGLDLSSIDANHLQLWSMPGYPLPEPNDAARPSLTQIPVILEDGGDDELDSGDRILFYGNSVNKTERLPDKSFNHAVHPYSNYNYVFLTVGDSDSKRIPEFSSSGNTSLTVSQTVGFSWLEEELNKPEDDFKSGRNWLGRAFNVGSGGSGGRVSSTIFQDTIPGLASNQTMRIKAKMVSRSENRAQFDFAIGDQSLTGVSINSIYRYNASTGYAARSRTVEWEPSVNLDGNTIEITSWYNYSDQASKAWTDWIEVSYLQELVAEDNYLTFFAPEDGTENEDATYQLEGFESTPYVLQINQPMAPRRLPVESNDGTYEAQGPASYTSRFLAQSSPFEPLEAEQMDNQDLKGIASYPEYIIITAESLLESANELAGYREQNNDLNSVVVTQKQIFNEFSGGVPDMTAIRDYLKFLYDRAGQSNMPKNVLMFGDTHFDYKNNSIESEENLLFTFQTSESLYRTESYGSDDFFVLLDDSEGHWDGGTEERIDMGIGRLPVNSPAQAQLMIDKIKAYESPETHGPWRTRFTFTADDDINGGSLERDLHVLNADGTAETIDQQQTGVRLQKVYQLSYPIENTAAGRRAPQATADFIESINEGTLIINYSGHGSEQTLSAERLFHSDYISQLDNWDRPTIFVTATCSFGRFDDNETESGAEKLVLTENGGAIAAFTTTRVVYTSSNPNSLNFGLNIQLTRDMLRRDAEGKPLRFGDIYRLTKNTSVGASRNSRKFILLGDPAMRIGLPDELIEIEGINSVSADSLQNSGTHYTANALQKVSIDGSVINRNTDQLQGSSNGELEWTVFDASRNIKYPPEGWVNSGNCYLDDCDYTVRNDILFKGRASVTNGQFNGEFVVPKDISFADRNGRISMYGSIGNNDAVGSFSNVRFNGVDTTAAADNNGPDMDIYLNDPGFINGNLVNSAPQLNAELEDESGINTTGNGVGHEIIATIEGEETKKKTIVLNKHYTSELNDYTQGKIEYQLNDLPEGDHTLTLRAWDVHNNPAEKQIHFTVQDQNELAIRNVFNYPNPLNRNTEFVFEHNQAGSPLDVVVRIYTLSGKPVDQIRKEVIPSGSYVKIPWDGRDRDNDLLASGTYLYVLRVSAETPDGKQQKRKQEKLVIIR